MTGAAPPPSLLGALLGFFHRLRDARVPVSMVEVLDAAATLRHVDLSDRAQLRAALAATLVKRPQDLEAFAVLFDASFPLTAGAPEVATSLDRAAGGNGGNGHGPNGEPGNGEPSDELLAALLGALTGGDEGALRALAAAVVDRHGGMEAQPDASERYYLYRILRQVELYRLVERALAAGDAEPGERERLARRVEEFRRLLAEAVRQRLAARAGPAAGGDLYRDRQLDEVDFLGANFTQLEELRATVRPLARKLAARLASKRRQRRRGRLDVRRTVRRSLSSGGVPVEPAFRAVHASKPDLYVLADVSGSVVEFAKFTLSLLHAMRQELGRMRSFAFVDGIDEVTDLLADGSRFDLRSTFARAKVVHDDGHSDYGNVLAAFLERYGPDVDRRSTVLVMGDARGNYRPPGAESLRALHERARKVYWLNPEPQAEWDTTDSVMHLYRPHCDRVFEVRNLRQLGDCVYQIGE